MVDQADAGINTVRRWWQGAAALTGFEQQKSPFRRCEAQQSFALCPDEDSGELGWQVFAESQKWMGAKQRFNSIPLNTRPGQGASPRLALDYRELLLAISEREDCEATSAAHRYDTMQLPAKATPSSENASRWMFNPTLGLRRYRE